MLAACVKSNGDGLYACLQKIVGSLDHPFLPLLPPLRRKRKLLAEPKNKNKVHPSLSEMPLVDTPGTLFEYYAREIFRSGVPKWRVIEDHLEVVVMNDYDDKTGNIKVCF